MLNFRALHKRSRRTGFTLVELLVVMAVISILATLVMPALLRSITATKGAACIANLRQMGQGFTQYTAAWESWLICAGNNATEHDADNPIREDAWIQPWRYRADFPYWYEVLTDFVNPGLTLATLNAAYKAQFNGAEWPDLSAAADSDLVQDVGQWTSDPDQDLEDMEDVRLDDTAPVVNQALATKIANMRYIKAKVAGVFACPELKQNVVGYGYNYVAPFGNPSCYGSYGHVKHFEWKRSSGEPKNYPCRYVDSADPWMIPLLWFGRSAHFGVLTQPSQQILICDTGYILNAYHDVTANHFNLKSPRHPSEWLERVTGSREGYVRFPLSDATVEGASYKLRRYRPIARHANRVSCLMFDGSAQPIDIMEIVGRQWGEEGCWYDNIPKTKPPVSPLSARIKITNDDDTGL